MFQIIHVMAPPSTYHRPQIFRRNSKRAFFANMHKSPSFQIRQIQYFDSALAHVHLISAFCMSLRTRDPRRWRLSKFAAALGRNVICNSRAAKSSNDVPFRALNRRSGRSSICLNSAPNPRLPLFHTATGPSQAHQASLPSFNCPPCLPYPLLRRSRSARCS